MGRGDWQGLGSDFIGGLSVVHSNAGDEAWTRAYVAIWCGLALSAYTILALWKFRPYDRIADPGAPPNGDPAKLLGNSGVAGGRPSVS